ncbi:MAG: hypothetical protein R3B48_17920 [Kofleriaceae bacterium]
MTISRRTVRALCDVRGRLRDLAAAEHSSRSETQLRAEELVAAARHELEGSLELAAGAVQGARGVDTLDRMSELVAAHHVCVDEAGAELAAAVMMTEETAQLLRERSRQVLSAERVLQRYQRESALRAHRQEQRVHDDHPRRLGRDTKPR